MSHNVYFVRPMRSASTVPLHQSRHKEDRESGKCPSFRTIAAGLAKRGHTVLVDRDGQRVSSGKPYGAESVKRMLTRKPGT